MNRPWTVSQDSNRVAVRLEGPTLQRSRTDELPSEGLVRGAVQVPASGQPLIFGSDHPVTGGYPVIAVLTERDADHAAQLRPGETVRFGLDSRTRRDRGGSKEAGVDIRKVLIANRGEIAVRVIRAAADAGIASVAVYADSDADALFVTLADEAYALGGTTPGETYLDIDKILGAAAKSGADAIHPGYGFLAENAAFATAVIEAGLIWIGPPPAAIDALGDKVQARHIAQKVGAPLVPGTPNPVADAAEVRAFAEEHGLPIAIKAAYGGGGRGLKVAREMGEIEQLFESATREAVSAFGRGECFVERYLDKPRHVETQCLADTHGNVVVISTRDCSLQRRHQKLVEEAPAPFLSVEQTERLYSASKAILTEAGYVGRGHVRVPRRAGRDDLVPRGEHPAPGGAPGVGGGDRARPGPGDVPDRRGRAAGLRRSGRHRALDRVPPQRRGRRPQLHARPGTLTAWTPPAGPGVRVDEGYRAGMTVPGTFDSLVAKIIVTGADRDTALARSRRALRELVIEGMPTVLPFHQAVLDDPAFTAADGHFGVHTRWIETEFAGDIAPYEGPSATPDEPEERTKVRGRGERQAARGGGARRLRSRQRRRRPLAPRSRPGAAADGRGHPRPDRPAPP